MRRRWKRNLVWAAVLFGVLLLAIPATIAQATVALRTRGRRSLRRFVPILALVALAVVVDPSPLASVSPAGVSRTTVTLVAVCVG